MALKLFLGNSGCGKTQYMYEQVVRLAEKNPRTNYLVLVPEQFTMQTQRKLVDLSRHQAIMNVDVLSFQRLAYRVFDEMGIGDIRILEETGKNLVLRKVAQEKAEELTVLRGNMQRMGYIGEIKSLLSELMQYNVQPERLAECMEKEGLSHSLRAKLQDVYVMYQGFLDYLRGHYITPEELLHVLAEYAPKSELLKDSVLVLDEFTGFTPVQVELLQNLMGIVSDIWVSLTIDVKENFYHSKGMHELFNMPKQTIRTLMDLAVKSGMEIADPVVLTGGEEKRFRNAPALYFMEQNLFRSRYQRKFGEHEEIQIVSLKNPKEELSWAARKINELVQKKGYRYRDIAVVSAEVEMYGNYVEQVCKKYQIPYFLDMTKEVLFHPFIEFVRAILEVIRCDFSYHAVMRLLRTGYCGYTQEQIDKLENYLLAMGIRGRKMWMDRWMRLPKNEKAYNIEELEEIRVRFMDGLLPVVKTFTKKHTVEEQIKALYVYITGLEVEKQLMQREKELLQVGEQAKSKEYGQIYRIVMEVFQKCIHVLGKETLSIQELGEILDAGFEAAKVAVLPPGYDSVTIGDIERTRLNHVEVLIFLGVNEGIVPKSLNQGGIISQYERDSLEAAEIALAPGTREQSFIQRFYLYLNMTKPSEQLYLTYSRTDSEGSALRPSYLIRILLQMFPDMKVQEIEELEEILDTSTKEAASEYLLSEKRTAEWYALAKCFLENGDEQQQDKIKKIVDAFYYKYNHDPISRLVAEAIYGKRIEGSVTRLENFARCAYSHFLAYGLKLKEREESGFAHVDMGNLYHDAVEIYSKKLAESSYDWFTVPDEVRDGYATEAMQQAVLAYPNLSVYATAEDSHLVYRMNDIFQKTVWALTKQVRKGQFVPTDFEIAFSRVDGLETLQFELENHNKIQLKGRIDRLDICVDEDKLYVKVIDYKSGSTKFDLVQVYQGLQLQLVVYMNAVMELEKKMHPAKEIVPGGMFYYHIDDPVIEVTEELSEAEILEEVLKKLKPSGLVNQEERVYLSMDQEFEKKSNVIPLEYVKSREEYKNGFSQEQFETLSEYVNHNIVQTGNKIFAGNVEISPSMQKDQSGCDYCPYAAICGFDKKITGFEERKLKNIDAKQVFEQMETDNAIFRAEQKNRKDTDTL